MKKMGKRLMSVALALTMMVGIMWGRPLKAEARELLTNNVIFVVVNGAGMMERQRILSFRPICGMMKILGRVSRRMRFRQ